ncbi:hypothetical protein B0T21DRAFT_376534 [Apiosordaria backusii]|uniref:Uncharacterized protein n=1 Tax=Apiosordaria backusii TaxID=314023 RepID=A0AA40A6X8_9PEZI|nr:hypothetical protein B0T21DRAFT_376534 [Apiosordaria backusii]
MENALGPAAPDAVFLSCHGYNSEFIYEFDGDPAWWEVLSSVASDHFRFLYDNKTTPFSSLVQGKHDEVMAVCTELWTMEFLTNLYIDTRLRSFRNVGRQTAHPLTKSLKLLRKTACAPPSSAERLRVLRAFYRRQQLCNIWAPTERVELIGDYMVFDEEMIAINKTTVDDDDSEDHRPLGLLAIFEEWEQQQIDHINVFVSRLCAALCLAADAHKDPISEDLLGDMMCKATSLVKYIHDHRRIADHAIDKVALFPRCDTNCRLSNNGDGRNHPYGEAIDKFSLPFFTAEWNSLRREVCPDDYMDEGFWCRFTKDAVDSPPFGWVDAVDGWYRNGIGRAFVGKIDEVDDGYKDIADVYDPGQDTYALGVFRVAGLAMWDRNRVEAIKELPQLVFRGLLKTGWAQVVMDSDADSDTDPMDYNSEFDFDSDDDLPPHIDEDAEWEMMQEEERLQAEEEELQDEEKEPESQGEASGSDWKPSDNEEDDTSDW